MTENKWATSLLALKPGTAQCLVAFCFCYPGVCAVQACNAKRMSGKWVKPLCCAGCLLCVGMAINRKALRKEYKIPGSCLLDTLLYMFGCCFLVAQEYREIDEQKSKQIAVALPPMPSFDPPEPGPVVLHKVQEPDPNLSPVTSPVSASDRHPNTDNTSDSSEKVLTVAKTENRARVSNPPPYGTMGDIVDPSFDSEHSIDIPLPPPPPAPVEIPEVAIVPVDGSDPQVYSTVLATPPFSFLIGIDPSHQCPPPTYIPLSELKKPKPQQSREIWVGLDNDREGGLVCVDEEALRRQEGVATHVLKQLGWAIIKGLGAVSISLPIRIFEPRSTCERIFDRFSFAPVFLSRAAQSSDKWERFKLVLAFAVSSLYMGVKQEKPFNPLLGETMQGSFPDGAQVYSEHTAHNPPTDHFYITAPGYKIFGYYQLDGSFTGNSLVGSFRGPTTVYFRDGQAVTYQQPRFKLGGVLAGRRTLNWVDTIEFQDAKNNWCAVIKIQANDKAFNPQKLKLKQDEFLGKIYTPQGGRRDKIGEVLAELSGSWMECLKITTPGGATETIWAIDRDLPLRHSVEDRPIPSDWRYREDLIWLFRGNQDTAQAWKSKLEQRQREDREMRAEGARRRRRPPRSTKGWTWGDYTLRDKTLTFNTNGQLAFEVSYEDVANCSLPSKNEVAVEFHQPDAGDRDLLCEMRLTLTAPEAAEALHDQILTRAQLGEHAGDAICSLYGLPFVTPRGKYQLDLFSKFFKLHGKTHDYKIMYRNVTRTFLLPKLDGLFVAFVIALDLPIRQGNTHYPFLVMEFNKEMEENVSLSHAPEELGERLDGKLFDVLSRLFKELAGVSVIIPGNFRSSSDMQAIKCSIKANEGLLYPLQKSFLFIHKPVLHIRFEDIRGIEFARVSENTLSANRYFDLRISVESASYQFTGIDRQEYKPLMIFLEKKKLNISNLRDEDRERESGAEEEMEEDEEEDEDFVGQAEDADS